MPGMTALVLAGGSGNSTDVLCDVSRQPALSFAGGFSVIDFSLSNCVQSGIRNVAILTDYRSSQLSNYLYRRGLVDARWTKFDILEPKNDSYKGTAGSVYQHLDHLRKSDSELVLVLAGDHVYKMDYRKMAAFHLDTKADVTVGVVNMAVEKMHRFDAVRLDADSRITDFVDKPRCSPSNPASMGIYVFNKRVLIERLTEDVGRPASQHDFGYNILPEMARRDKVYAYLFQGYWPDINSKDEYRAGLPEVEAGVTVVGKRPIVPKRTAVGRNCTIQPHRTQDDFIGSVAHS